jgi:hypothetical protein
MNSTDFFISLTAWLSGTGLALLISPQFVTIATVLLTALASIAGQLVKPWAEYYFEKRREADRKKRRLRRRDSNEVG